MGLVMLGSKSAAAIEDMVGVGIVNEYSCLITDNVSHYSELLFIWWTDTGRRSGIHGN